MAVPLSGSFGAAGVPVACIVSSASCPLTCYTQRLAEELANWLTSPRGREGGGPLLGVESGFHPAWGRLFKKGPEIREPSSWPEMGPEAAWKSALSHSNLAKGRVLCGPQLLARGSPRGHMSASRPEGQ